MESFFGKPLSTLFGFFCFCFLAHSAWAKTYSVNVFDDPAPVHAGSFPDNGCDTGGRCSLREAVLASGVNGDPSSIINLGAGTYTLTIQGSGEDVGVTGDLDVNVHSITINGQAANNTIIDASALSDRILDANHEDLVLANLTLRGGTAPASDMLGGGAVRVSGSPGVNALTIDHSNLSGNSAQGSLSGGGVLSFGVNVIINSSTISNNTAAGGGGGISVSTGINTGDFVKINNSTLSGNSAPRGGGILESNSIITVRSSTIFANHATSGQGGGVILDPSLGPASIHFENSILAGNTATANSQDCFKSPTSVVTSQGYNLFGDVTDCPIPGPQPGDQVVTDPKLEALGDNGGPTPTHLPMNDSPAVNGGNPAGCKDADGNLLTQDQRGQPRPVGGNCDIGAVELGTTTPATPAPTSGGCSLGESGVETGSWLLGLLQLPFIGFWWMWRKRLYAHPARMFY